VPFSPIAAHRLHFATHSLAAEPLTDKHQQQQGNKHGVHECSFGATAGRVQRKNNRSGVLIEQYGGFAISTRNAEGGAGFAFAASLAPRAIRAPRNQEQRRQSATPAPDAQSKPCFFCPPHPNGFGFPASANIFTNLNI
jgi:hypothetical protein